VEEAYRLVTAASGGAERFEGRMIESMHVAAARALIERAEACGMGR
jgi:citrate lyase subunit beta/citryl-CoA lyase